MIVLLPSNDEGDTANKTTTSTTIKKKKKNNRKRNRSHDPTSHDNNTPSPTVRRLFLSLAFGISFVVSIRNFQHVSKDIASLSAVDTEAQTDMDTPSIFTQSFQSFYSNKTSIITNNNQPSSPGTASSISINNAAHPDIFANAASNVPQWMRDYFHWHHATKSQLTPDNWNATRYLVMTCFRGRKCGGSTDRLRPIPAFLKLAARSNRLLLIFWERPYPLEEFLVPPQGGLDWRMPAWLVELLRSHRNTANNIAFEKVQLNLDQFMLFQYQSWNYGELWYKDNTPEGEAGVYEIFRDVWKAVFTPAPPVANRVREQLATLHLTPGEYATAHMRVLYAIKERDQNSMFQIVHNAMNCVSNLRPGGPFFVASDSNLAVEEAQRYGQSKHVTVVYAHHDQEPLHVGLHPEDDPDLAPAKFYDAFVDMYLVAHTRCVAVGPGGFARWGDLLGYNTTCRIHHNGRKAKRCEWTDGNVPQQQSTTNKVDLNHLALMPPPMEPMR